MPAPATSRSTRLLAVVGDPVAHSLSPAMHNAAIQALGLDALYVATRTTAQALPGLVREMLRDGGALNVTVPFKRQAATLVNDATPLVTRTGACNTIWGSAEHGHGDNTDVAGVRVEARRLMAAHEVRRAILLGTGGSARAAAVAIADEWPGAEVLVSSRDAQRSSEFLGWAQSAGVRAAALTDHARAELVVNATPLGLKPGDALPLLGEALARHGARAVLDLVYARGETPWVREARGRKLAACDGRGVLVEQGAAVFERFFEVRPPVEVMRKAVEDALRP